MNASAPSRLFKSSVLMVRATSALYIFGKTKLCSPLSGLARRVRTITHIVALSGNTWRFQSIFIRAYREVHTIVRNVDIDTPQRVFLVRVRHQCIRCEPETMSKVLLIVMPQPQSFHAKNNLMHSLTILSPGVELYFAVTSRDGAFVVWRQCHNSSHHSSCRSDLKTPIR